MSKNLWDIPKAGDMVDTIFPRSYAESNCCAFCGTKHVTGPAFPCKSSYSWLSATQVHLLTLCTIVHTGKPVYANKYVLVTPPGSREECAGTKCAFCGTAFGDINNNYFKCGANYKWARTDNQVYLEKLCDLFLKGTCIIALETQTNKVAKCTCKMSDLLLYGCKCGALKLERENGKRV